MSSKNVNYQDPDGESAQVRWTVLHSDKCHTTRQGYVEFSALVTQITQSILEKPLWKVNKDHVIGLVGSTQISIGDILDNVSMTEVTGSINKAFGLFYSQALVGCPPTVVYDYSTGVIPENFLKVLQTRVTHVPYQCLGMTMDSHYRAVMHAILDAKQVRIGNHGFLETHGDSIRICSFNANNVFGFQHVFNRHNTEHQLLATEPYVKAKVKHIIL